MKKIASISLALLGLGLANPAGLYAPAPPPDAAFVRVVNATPAAVRASARQTVLAERLAFAAVTPYKVIKGGSYTLEVGGRTISVDLEAGRFYTVSLTPSGLWLNPDQTASSLTKARISLYNLSGTPLSLKTADGQLTLMPRVTPGQYAMLQVGAVKARLAVFAGNAKPLKLPETDLQANSAYSVMVFNQGGTLKAVWLQNTTETLK
ncbi:MAG: alginate O-acetyltransferase AlgF [Meiothermus sp.]|nr:alginate O-acetyltransferase AlgF [Meiothermus sp.]